MGRGGSVVTSFRHLNLSCQDALMHTHTHTHKHTAVRLLCAANERISPIELNGGRLLDLFDELRPYHRGAEPRAPAEAPGQVVTWCRPSVFRIEMCSTHDDIIILGRQKKERITPSGTKELSLDIPWTLLQNK